MKVIYVTTSITSFDFEEAIKEVNFKSNPSNQNFHHALIRAFASFYDVSVLSSANALNDINKTTEIEDYIPYSYLPYDRHSLLKYFHIKKALKNKLIEEYNTSNDFILVVDAMNVTLCDACLEFKKKHKVKIIGVITDNPNFISNAKKTYIKKVLQNAHKFDAYICLSESLNTLTNIKRKPFIIIDGIFEKKDSMKVSSKEPYMFFGGALYEKYGVKTLIDAFLEADTNYKLLIAGNGPMQEYVAKKAIRNYRNITYLGTLSQKELQSYQNLAVANINPRPFDKEMDKYCIPSKVFEYAASNAITISTYHSRLNKIFGSSIIWIDDNKTSMTNAIEKVAKMSKEEKSKKISRAHNIIKKNYTISEIGKKIDSLIKNIA